LPSLGISWVFVLLGAAAGVLRENKSRNTVSALKYANELQLYSEKKRKEFKSPVEEQKCKRTKLKVNPSRQTRHCLRVRFSSYCYVSVVLM
jgi:hypothetical protein